MLFKLLSNLFYFYKYLTTPRDYSIISEEIAYEIDHDMKYQIEDDFWRDESKSWDGILEQYYVKAKGKNFRHTTIPQNVKYVILRVEYSFNGHIYKAISNDINFKPGDKDEQPMKFSIPLSNVCLVDHDDKPQRDITEKVKRYIGPRNDFHEQSVSLEHFLYYDRDTLKERFPKVEITNSIGMKKTISTLNGFTIDLRIP